MSMHRSVQELEFYNQHSSLMPISFTRGILGWALVGCPHPQFWCRFAPLNQISLLNFIQLFHECASIRSRVSILPPTQQANAHIIH